MSKIVVSVQQSTLATETRMALEIKSWRENVSKRVFTADTIS